MLLRLIAAAVLATIAVAPLRSQSLAGTRAGLSSPVPSQPSALRSLASEKPAGASRVSGSEDTGDKLMKGIVTGAAVGLVVGYLINLSQSDTAGAKSVLLPAVGLGALLGLMLGSG